MKNQPASWRAALSSDRHWSGQTPPKSKHSRQTLKSCNVSEGQTMHYNSSIENWGANLWGRCRFSAGAQPRTPSLPSCSCSFPEIQRNWNPSNSRFSIRVSTITTTFQKAWLQVLLLTVHHQLHISIGLVFHQHCLITFQKAWLQVLALLSNCFCQCSSHSSAVTWCEME